MRGSGNYVEEDEEDEGGDFEEGAAAGSLTPGAKLALGGSYDLSDWSVENFLPSGKTCLVTLLPLTSFFSCKVLFVCLPAYLPCCLYV